MELKLKNNSLLRISSFTQLSYIESTGTQYIQLPFKASLDLDFEIEAQYKELNNNVFGSYINGNSAGSYGIIYYNNQIYINVGGTKGAISSDFSKHLYKVSSQQMYIDNISKGSFSSLTPAAENMILFGTTGDNGPHLSKIRIYSVIFKRNNTKILELLPVKDNNNVVCMYDSVSERFFYNQGTGNFIAGPDVGYSFPAALLLKTTSIFHQNTPNVNALSLIKDVVSYQKTHQEEVILLNRIRADIGNVEGPISDILELFGMAGFNDNYEPQAKPRLVGTYTVTEFVSSEFEQYLRNNCPDGLTLNVPNVVLPEDCLMQSFDKDGANYNPGVCILYRAGAPIKMVYNKDGSKGLCMLSSDLLSGNAFNFVFGGGNWLGYEYVTDTYGECVESYNNGSYDSTKKYYITTLSFLENLPSNITKIGLGLSNYTSVTDSVIKIAPYAMEINFGGLTSFIRNNTRYVFEIGENVTKITNYNNYGGQSKSICHLLAETPPTMTSQYAIPPTYVGDGSSAEHDDAILQAYLAVSPWSGYASSLKTWYSYLHPSA